MKGYSVVGRSVPRLEGIEKASGRASFAVDVRLPHMLYGKIVRSERSHARIIKIDVSKARELAGVAAVVTGRDAPPNRIGVFVKDRPFIAWDKVRYIGEPVAAVAAVDEETAERAAKLIQVEYQDLPAVFDPLEAMKPDAPVVHEDLASYVRMLPGDPPKHPSKNVCSYTRVSQGDVEKGFREADYVFEDTFTTHMQEHCTLEPHGAVVDVEPVSARATVWTSTNGAFMPRALLAEGLGMPMSKIRVIVPYVGGAFGGKATLEVEQFCFLLSQKTGRPVKIVTNREDEFTGTVHRLPSVIRRKVGVKKDGSLVALEAELIYDTGAYGDLGAGIVSYAAQLARGPYRVPHVLVTGYCVYTNKTPGGPFRGFGDPQSVFAYEVQMDTMAHRLGLDPLDFRLRNLIGEGDRMATGQVLQGVAVRECLQKVAEQVGWLGRKGRKADGQGLGLACMQHLNGELSSCAFVKVHEDGTIGVVTGSVEVGGGQHTVLAQIAAEELGVPIEDISISAADTEAVPYDQGTIASRVTYHMGSAVKAAAADAKRQLFLMAAEMLEAKPEDLEIGNRLVRVKGSPERAIPIVALSALSHFVRGGPEGGPIIGKGSFFEAGIFEPGGGVEGTLYGPPPFPTFAAVAAEVEVDRQTGNVRVLRLVAAHDCGRAINPLNIEGQIEGGVTQGLGLALMEEMVFDGGKVANPTLMDYKVPRSLDVPKIEPAILEFPLPGGPFGAKGVGEPTPVCVSPAIANAIYDAVGVRISDLPISGEKVLKALKGKEALA